jgi:hypothetical protein
MDQGAVVKPVLLHARDPGPIKLRGSPELRLAGRVIVAFASSPDAGHRGLPDAGTLGSLQLHQLLCVRLRACPAQ